MVSTEEQKTDSTRMTRESVAGATAGVIEAGVAIPGDLTFSGYCNFPHRPKSPVPVRRFGYDVRQLLQEFIELIDRQHEGGQVSRRTLQPIIEDDYS
jgi:hypothetical protein